MFSRCCGDAIWEWMIVGYEAFFPSSHIVSRANSVIYINRNLCSFDLEQQCSGVWDPIRYWESVTFLRYPRSGDTCSIRHLNCRSHAAVYSPSLQPAHLVALRCSLLPNVVTIQHLVERDHATLSHDIVPT